MPSHVTHTPPTRAGTLNTLVLPPTVSHAEDPPTNIQIPFPAASVQPFSKPLTADAWQQAYNACNVFNEAYTAAANFNNGDRIIIPVLRRILSLRLNSYYLLIGINEVFRIFVAEDITNREHILYKAHDHLTAGHLGTTETYRAFARIYYWPEMQAYCTSYVVSCVQCQTSKSLCLKPARTWPSHPSHCGGMP